MINILFICFFNIFFLQTFDISLKNLNAENVCYYVGHLYYDGTSRQQEALENCKQRQADHKRVIYKDTCRAIALPLALTFLTYCGQLHEDTKEGLRTQDVCSILTDPQCPSLLEVNPRWQQTWDSMRKESHEMTLLVGILATIPAAAIYNLLYKKHQLRSQLLTDFKQNLEIMIGSSLTDNIEDLQNIYSFDKPINMDNFTRRWKSDFRIKLSHLHRLDTKLTQNICNSIQETLEMDARNRALTFQYSCALFAFMFIFHTSYMIWDNNLEIPISPLALYTFLVNLPLVPTIYRTMNAFVERPIRNQLKKVNSFKQKLNQVKPF